MALLRHLRQLFVVQHIGAVHELEEEQRIRLERALEQSTHIAAERLDRLTAQAHQLDERQLIHIIETLGHAQGEIKAGLDARLQLELALVKATRPQLDHSLAGLEERLRQLEMHPSARGGGAGAAQAAPAQAGAAAASGATGAESGAAASGGADGDAAVEPAAGSAHDVAAAEAPPTLASAAPQAAAASELTLARAQRGWELVQQRLQATDVALAAALAAARPAGCADGRLTVAVSSSFALAAASRTGAAEAVAEAVEHTLGSRPQVVFQLARGAEAASTPRGGPAPSAAAPAAPAAPAAGQDAPSPAGASAAPASAQADGGGEPAPADAPPPTSLTFAEKIRLVQKELDAKILSDEP